MARSSNPEAGGSNGKSSNGRAENGTGRHAMPFAIGAIGAGAPIAPELTRREFPVAEPIELEQPTELNPQPLPPLVDPNLPQPIESIELKWPLQPEVIEKSRFCSLQMPQGCYRLTVRPNNEMAEYHGTLRIDKEEGPITASGDLYRYRSLNTHIDPNLLEPVTVFSRQSELIGKFRHKTIPIYPINRYHSYLKVTRVRLWSLVPPGGTCTGSITAEQYLYTQPPAGSFNGTFSPAPGARTVTFTFRQVSGPTLFAGPRFEGTMYVGGVDSGTVEMQWVSSFFRRCTVEIDTLDGAVAPQAVPAHPTSKAAAQGKTHEDFRTMMASAGWDARIEYDTSAVPVPAGVTPNACWSSANLHALMVNVRKPTTNLDTEWRLHCVVVPAAMGCSRGIMYDTIAVPREGVASFSDDGYPTSHSSHFGTAANQTQRNTPRAFLRSCSHEIVHGFNQIHQEQEGGADNSIMTTTPSVADVLEGATSGDPGIFPDDIRLEVNSHVRHHLVHMPDICVRPGGMTFGSGHGGSFVPQADRYTFTVDELQLTVDVEDAEVAIGEPVRIRYRLTNNGTESLPVPSEISVESTYATITVIDAKGRAKEMPPFVIRCEAAGIALLAPGASLEAETRVFWSSEGFAFTAPGTHVIDVALMWTANEVPCLVRGQASVTVSTPISELDDAAAGVLLHPQVGMYVALGGGAPHLQEAVARLNSLTGGGRADATGGAAIPKALRGFDGLLPPSRIELDEPARARAGTTDAPRQRSRTSASSGRRR
jgi:hypothetical protein